MRQGLQDLTAPKEGRTTHVISLATAMLVALKEAYGTMEDGTLWDQREGEGQRWRSKGFPKLMLLAVVLDPRTKDGPGIGPEDWSQVTIQ